MAKAAAVKNALPRKYIVAAGEKTNLLLPSIVARYRKSWPEARCSDMKGAFTGALAQKIGSFELANGGTIFLDEIANLTYDVQVSLLRVVQERKMRRVGGTKDIGLDIRIIVASNMKLWDASAGVTSAKTCIIASTNSPSTCRRCASATATSCSTHVISLPLPMQS